MEKKVEKTGGRESTALSEKQLKKRVERAAEGSDGEGEKKRPRYSRAPPGSLANPDWDRLLGFDA